MTKERKASLWTRQLIEQLILQYRQHECLWNPYTEYYKHKGKRSKAIESICQALQVSKPEFAKKIHNLRNQFNSEYKKYERRLEEAEELEDSSAKDYHCRWVHFESLMFLKDVIAARPGGYQTQQSKRIRLEAAGTNSSQTALSGDDIAEYHIEEGSEEEFDGFEANDVKNNFQRSLVGTDEVLTNNSRNDARELIALTSSSASPTKYFTRMQLRPQTTPEDLKEPAQQLNSSSALELASAGSTTSIPQEKQSGTPLKGALRETACDSLRDQWSAFGEFIANELRNYNSDLSRRKLKRKIMQAMLEVSEEDDASLVGVAGK